MQKRLGIGTGVVTVVFMACSLTLVILAHAKGPATSSAQKGPAMASHAIGAFEVKMTPQKPDNPIEEAAHIARLTGDKQWHGDLEGASKLEMLATAPDAKGSGVYVALERVTGTLKGRSGTFLLHHTGIMDRGKPTLTILVAPDSGTGQFTGLTGKMTINITPDGKHSYDFEYTLPDTQ
ncbi:MAG TPA: DUF3224 domain-containing protein [Candidatus Angelobacter sp.]|nr:DUF3224 domain-containing protein [Candidatus Angelobacter sp.]